MKMLLLATPCVPRLATCVAGCLLMATSVVGQADVPAAEVCELLVEGRVQRLFSSSDGTRLVELQLRSVALADTSASHAGIKIPAPGEVVYVDAGIEKGILGRLRGAGRVPEAGELIKASLRAEGRGAWSAAGSAWFKSVSENAASQPGTRTDRRFQPADAEVSFRGMSCQAKLVGGQLGLEVKQVERGSPAQQAGFQPGDVVIALSGKPLSAAADLQRVEASAEAIELTVIDVNTGRQANVTVPPGAGTQSAGVPADQDMREAAALIAKALGVVLQPGRNGRQVGVKVAQVERNSPGADAGLEVGDVIVKVGRQEVSDEQQFAQALPRRAGTLTLVVRDVRSGREVPIEVRALGTDSQSAPMDRPADPPTTDAANGWGIQGEVTFFNAEAAVRVVRVTPNSPADRAGIQPGMILVMANGQPILHPDDLSKLPLGNGDRVEFRGVNPATNREFTVEVAR